jgi:antitoxin component HigA of HigAB toxin-antitoxin module
MTDLPQKSDPVVLSHEQITEMYLAIIERAKEQTAKSGTRQADLVGIIGSNGVVSEVVNGKRAISKAQTKALGDYFKISASLFI